MQTRYGMQTRYFALILGIVYALVGILGFIPGLTNPPPAGSPVLSVDGSYGLLLGLFPVNVLHNIVHLLVGLAGIAAYASFQASKTYARVVFVIFALLTVLGLIPGGDTTFGLIPLYGNDIWLHALTALVSGYFGFVAEERRVPTT